MSQGKSKAMPMQMFWGFEAVYYGIVQVVNELVSEASGLSPNYPTLSSSFSTH